MPDQSTTRVTFPDGMSVIEARQHLRARLGDGPFPCPCCGQNVERYSRPLAAPSARLIVELYTHHGQEFAHLPTLIETYLPKVATQGGHLYLGQHWGLMERQFVKGRRRAGWWRVADDGVAWLRGEFLIPARVLIYNDEVHGWEGENISPADALETRFDFAEIHQSRASADPVRLAA